MDNIRIYTEDLALAQSILKKDESATKCFFYRDCYPMFYSLYKNYCTDCDNCIEFISEIYLHIMTPNEETHKCPLESYRGESKLQTWIRVIAVFYCYKKYRESKLMVSFDESSQEISESFVVDDSSIDDSSSIDLDTSSINRDDVNVILSLMPNERYRMLIRLRYLDQMPHEEVAKILGLKMEVYYNKHKLAKEQYIKCYRKEESYGK